VSSLIDGKIMPVYPRRFFELQLAFARAIAKVMQEPFPKIVLRYTATVIASLC